MLRGGEKISQVTQENIDRFGVTEIRILNTNADRGIDTIDVTVNTLIEARYNTASVWKFEYEQRTDGILLSRITPLTVAGASTDEIRGRVGG